MRNNRLAKRSVGPSGLYTLDVSLHALTDVATEYRPSGPKKFRIPDPHSDLPNSLAQYPFLVGENSLLVGNYGV